MSAQPTIGAPTETLEPGSRPAIGFEGDLFLVLESVVRRGDSVTVLRRIEVDVDGCDWMPISR